MLKPELVLRASEFAITAHEACGHKRKYNGEPYYYHVQRVAAIVTEHGGTSVMIAAAWLHDIIEDTHINSKMIHDWFGFEVGIHVDQLTNDKTVDRKTRKALEIERFRSAFGTACTIKLADILDNGLDFIKCGDEKAAQNFMEEKMRLLPILKDGANPILYEKVNKMIGNYLWKGMRDESD